MRSPIACRPRQISWHNQSFYMRFGGGKDVLGWSAGLRKITMVLFMVELTLEKKTAVFGSLSHLLIQGGPLPVINGMK